LLEWLSRTFIIKIDVETYQPFALACQALVVMFHRASDDVASIGRLYEKIRR
jgi:hypothetical protein